MVGKIEINKDETHPKEYHDVVLFSALLPTRWRWNRLSALTTEAVGGGEEMAAASGVNALPSAGVEERERSTRIMLSALCAPDNGRRLSPGFQMEVTMRAVAHLLL